MNKYFHLAAAAVCATALPAYSSPEVTTQVVNAGTYSNGNVFVTLATNVNGPGCTRTAIEILATSASAKQVLATALFALGAGKSVVVVTNACYLGTPSFDDTVRNSYFGVVN